MVAVVVVALVVVVVVVVVVAGESGPSSGIWYTAHGAWHTLHDVGRTACGIQHIAYSKAFGAVSCAHRCRARSNLFELWASAA